MMKAAYDLARNPPTYDVVTFLAMLELERLRRGEDSIELHILPGPNSGFRQDTLWPPLKDRPAVKQNVLVPLCKLLPSAVAVVDEGRRIPAMEAAFGASTRLISLPYIVKALAAGSRPLRCPSPPPAEAKLITFTLREATHHPLRNSRTDEWVAAAQTLSQRGWTVIVIRDTAKAGELLPGVVACPEASRVVEVRARFYSVARLNVGVCNGPMWLSIFMNAPTLMLRPVTDAAGGCYDSRFYAAYGLPRGSQLPTNPPHQRLVWEEDKQENIVRAVEEMLGVSSCRAG